MKSMALLWTRLILNAGNWTIVSVQVYKPNILKTKIRVPALYIQTIPPSERTTKFISIHVRPI